MFHIIITVHGTWGAWAEWTACTLSCGGGSRTRKRRCDNPPPGNGGNHCSGEEKQIDYCNKESCPGKHISNGLNICHFKND